MYIDERGAGRDVVALHGTPQDPEELADFAAGALPDARVVATSIEDACGTVFSKAGISGYEFLEKIIQLQCMPPGHCVYISRINGFR